MAKPIVQRRNPWENEDRRELLRLLIGDDFGTRPEERISDIRADKKNMAAYIAGVLAIDPRDVVLEIGSGCGFITAPIARLANHVHACDISRDFLDFARHECAAQRNITFHEVEALSLAGVADDSIDVAFANSVFIHFNLFDVYWTLHELARVVRAGGRVWFDIANTDGMDFETEPYFLKTALEYKEHVDRRATRMQWLSRESVVSLATRLGFADKSFGALRLLHTAYMQKRSVSNVRREVLLSRVRA